MATPMPAEAFLGAETLCRRWRRRATLYARRSTPDADKRNAKNQRMKNRCHAQTIPPVSSFAIVASVPSRLPWTVSRKPWNRLPSKNPDPLFQQGVVGPRIDAVQIRCLMLRARHELFVADQDLQLHHLALEITAVQLFAQQGLV